MSFTCRGFQDGLQPFHIQHTGRLLAQCGFKKTKTLAL